MNITVIRKGRRWQCASWREAMQLVWRYRSYELIKNEIDRVTDAAIKKICAE